MAIQDGWAPLHWASLKGPKTVCELLVQHGAEADVQNDVSQHCSLFVTPLTISLSKSFAGMNSVHTVKIIEDFWFKKPTTALQ